MQLVRPCMKHSHDFSLPQLRFSCLHLLSRVNLSWKTAVKKRLTLRSLGNGLPAGPQRSSQCRSKRYPSSPTCFLFLRSFLETFLQSQWIPANVDERGKEITKEEWSVQFRGSIGSASDKWSWTSRPKRDREDIQTEWIEPVWRLAVQSEQTKEEIEGVCAPYS